MRAAALALAVAAWGCGGGKGADQKPPEKNLGQQAADIASDTATTREAQAAVNEVVRAAGDCDSLKALAPNAHAALDVADRKIRTATGRLTLEGLRKQVRNIVEACP